MSQADNLFVLLIYDVSLLSSVYVQLVDNVHEGSGELMLGTISAVYPNIVLYLEAYLIGVSVYIDLNS